MDENDVRRALKTMFDKEKTTTCAWYKCTAVADRTCTILLDADNDLKVEGILLGVSKSGVVVYPVVNTDVLVVFIDGSKTNGRVVDCEEAERIEFMGNDFSGLVKVEELVKKLNDLEDLVTDLVTKYNAHTHVVSVVTACGAGAGSGNGTAVVTTASSTKEVVKTIKKDLENEKIKHGKG